MMVGNRYYSDADLMRMQRDAEERVREMRNRVRQTSDTDENSDPFMPAFANPNRNWSSNPNTQRNRGRGGRTGNRRPEREPVPETERENIPPAAENPHREEAEADTGSTTDIPSGGTEKHGATIIEDIISSIGVEGDTLLIIGLILILVNQKADATLILALAYLLI